MEKAAKIELINSLLAYRWPQITWKNRIKIYFLILDIHKKD